MVKCVLSCAAFRLVGLVYFERNVRLKSWVLVNPISTKTVHRNVFHTYLLVLKLFWIHINCKAPLSKCLQFFLVYIITCTKVKRYVLSKGGLKFNKAYTHTFTHTHTHTHKHKHIYLQTHKHKQTSITILNVTSFKKSCKIFQIVSIKMKESHVFHNYLLFFKSFWSYITRCWENTSNWSLTFSTIYKITNF